MGPSIIENERGEDENNKKNSVMVDTVTAQSIRLAIFI